MKEGRILLIDDNKSALTALSMLVQNTFKEVVCLSNPNAIQHEIERTAFDVALLDMNFLAGQISGNEGLFWLKKIKELSPSTEVVMMTAYGEIALAVKALKLGSTDFVLKPWDNDKLLATIKAAYALSKQNKQVARLQQTASFLKENFAKEVSLIGDSAPMQQVLKMIRKVAGTDANVLIEGENGTGKEVVAQMLHQLSKRSEAMFMNVDMGAIPESLFESELFGFKKGAFTDAKEDKPGKFQLADKGTLFLDEIGNTPMAMQAKLLVALERRTVSPLGSNQSQEFDIRLVTASNANLEAMVSAGSFRQDLLYRLNTIKIKLPALRDRGEDVELLALHFLKKFSVKYKKDGLRLGAQAVKKLANYHWPGNIRELQHAIEKAVIMSEGEVLMPTDFDLSAVQQLGSKELPSLSEMEKKLIINALDRYEGNLSLIAEKLGVSRQTLYNKIKRYAL